MFTSVLPEMMFEVGSYENVGNKVDNYYCHHPYCPVGSHILCMDPSFQGNTTRKCDKLKKINLIKEYADNILQQVNSYRSETASGLVAGYDGIFLPKAYGMMKVKWDSQLARNAQAWANTCPTTPDHCRATEKFSDPGQMVLHAPLRYEVYKELAPNQIRAAIKETLDSVYQDRKFVDVNMINHTPNWIRILTIKKITIYMGGQYFTNLVHSNVTHIGCGMSVAVTSARKQIEFPTFEPIYKAFLVCNLSHRPKPGFPVYEIKEATNKSTLYEKKNRQEHKKPSVYKKICTSKASCVALDFPEAKDEDKHEYIPKDIPQNVECDCPNGFKKTECLCELPSGNPQHEPTNGNNTESQEKPDPDCYEAELVLPAFADDNTKMRRDDLEDYIMVSMDNQDHITTKPRNYLSKPVTEINENIPRNIQDWEFKRKKKLKQNKNRQSLFSNAPKFKLQSVNSRPEKIDVIQKDLDTEINFDLENIHDDHESVPNFDSKPHEKVDSQRDYRAKIDFNEEFIYDDVPLHNFGSKPDKKYDIQSNYETEINSKTENFDTDGPAIEDNIPEIFEEKIHLKEESPIANEDSLIDLLDNIEKTIQNTPLGRGKKEIIHSKIKKIYSMVDISEDSDELHYSDTMQKVNNRNAEINDILSELEEVSNEDEISRRHRRKPPRNEHTLRTLNQRRTQPFNSKTHLSKGEFTIKKRIPYEDAIPKSYKNYEIYSHEDVKPILPNKNKIRKDLEALMEVVDSKYRNSEPEFSRPVDTYSYNNDEIDFEKDQEYRTKQGRYKDEINGEYRFEDKSKIFTTNDERTHDAHSKFDTESTYSEDSSDNEWIHFYKEKLNKYDNIKQHKPYRAAHFHDELRHRPVHIQRRWKDLGLSLNRPRPDHYYEQEYNY